MSRPPWRLLAAAGDNVSFGTDPIIADLASESESTVCGGRPPFPGGLVGRFVFPAMGSGVPPSRHITTVGTAASPSATLETHSSATAARRHARQGREPRGLRRRPTRLVRRGAADAVRPAIELPEDIADQTSAAMMLKGMTVQYQIRRTYKVQPGDTVLFHAAAGGVGLIACQWLKALGATVIGTVGSDEKAALAKAHRCDHAVVYTREDFARRVREITGGQGVPVVYDAVGKSTFTGSLDCLRPRGLMVSFGNASGLVPPLDIGILVQKGSLYLTRRTLATYTASRAGLEATAQDLFDVVLSGKVKIEVHHTYVLKDARQVHLDLEGRKTTGSIVMLARRSGRAVAGRRRIAVAMEVAPSSNNCILDSRRSWRPPPQSGSLRLVSPRGGRQPPLQGIYLRQSHGALSPHGLQFLRGGCQQLGERCPRPVRQPFHLGAIGFLASRPHLGVEIRPRVRQADQASRVGLKAQAGRLLARPAPVPLRALLLLDRPLQGLVVPLFLVGLPQKSVSLAPVLHAQRDGQPAPADFQTREFGQFVLPVALSEL